jgi:hypothetical protein
MQPVPAPADVNDVQVVALPTHGFTLGASDTLVVMGQRPLALVVYTDAIRAGIIDVSASGATGGPGAAASCPLGSRGTDGAFLNPDAGNGGGGFAGSGGQGAAPMLQAPAGSRYRRECWAAART